MESGEYGLQAEVQAKAMKIRRERTPALCPWLDMCQPDGPVQSWRRV